jgi:hypothetical protein
VPQVGEVGDHPMISVVLTMMVFSERLTAERVQAFWAALQRGNHHKQEHPPCVEDE